MCGGEGCYKPAGGWSTCYQKSDWRGYRFGLLADDGTPFVMLSLLLSRLVWSVSFEIFGLWFLVRPGFSSVMAGWGSEARCLIAHTSSDIWL